MEHPVRGTAVMAESRVSSSRLIGPSVACVDPPKRWINTNEQPQVESTGWMRQTPLRHNPARAICASLLALTSCVGTTASVWAQGTATPISNILPLDAIGNNAIMFPIFMGAFAFAMWSATWLIRARRQLDHDHRALARDHADLRARNERAQAMLSVPDQQVVVWDNEEDNPVCHGALSAQSGAPQKEEDFLQFENWLTPDSHQALSHAIERLRQRAQSFDLIIESGNKAIIEAQGRASGNCTFVRFMGLSGDRAALAELKLRHTNLVNTTDTMRALLESVPFPIWLCGPQGNMTWGNEAYVNAIESDSLGNATHHNGFLLDRSVRDRIFRFHEDAKQSGRSSRFRERLPATIAGDRKLIDVIEVSLEEGSAGIAVDMSEVEEVERKLNRTLESNVQTMDQLASAVAIFDEKRRLIFHNNAFQQVWQIERSVLENEPENGQLFDILRDAGKLAEQPDWSKWRNSLLQVYEATQPFEDWWHLPDGRTLRVVANPHKQGGVTWVFENITEQLEMESRYIALTQVQGETLDHLSEAIAVFSSDGRLKLSNPSFQKLWSLEDEQVAADTPISLLADICRAAMENIALWDDLITSITGVSERRKNQSGRTTLKDGTILDYALVPLPNGQTMVSFADISASVRLEHTLKEKNEALEAAEQLKNDFIEHVSYEFRAPLTNIKGFAEMLESQVFGPLTDKQREYVDHIGTSSTVLHGLVDNLLDLATVDAGIMELDRKPVILRDMVFAAARGVSAMLKENNVKLNVRLPKTGSDAEFIADPHRVQQVLANLLTNAIKFTPAGKEVTLTSFSDKDKVRFAVTDSGPGVAREDRSKIFDRFASKSQEGGQRGAGLGLAIARSLVDLHGGSIRLTDAETGGARFVCSFPKTPPDNSQVAREAA